MDFKYPYTDFHELNLDWFLTEFKKLTADWLQVQHDWEDQQQAFQDLHDYVQDYFANLNVYQEVHDILYSTEMQQTIQLMLSNISTSQLPNVVANQIASVVANQLAPVVAAQLPNLLNSMLPSFLPDAVAGEAAAWLNDHVDPDTGYVIDNSLSVSLAAADAKTTGDYIFNMLDYDAYDVMRKYTGTDGTHNGVTYTFSGNSCTTTGSTGSSGSFRNIFSNTSGLPDHVKAGDTLYFKVNTNNTKVRIAVFKYDSTQTLIPPNSYLNSDGTVVIPSNCHGLTVRVDIAANIADAGAVISWEALNHESTAALEKKSITMKGSISTGTDANTVTDTGCYFIDSVNTYTNLPVNNGLLFVYPVTKRSLLQTAYEWAPQRQYMRHYNVNQGWSSWTLISNDYLVPTGDATDRTALILSELTNKGVCHLGPGNFYVKNLVMPAGTSIKGVGAATNIILKGTGNDVAIQMGDYCEVSDLTISGSATDITLPASVGGRHGIYWAGDYSVTPDPTQQPKQGIISNVWIKSFSGGAITCYDTGYGTYNNLVVNNVQIRNCGVGINVSYWSEFHKFTNVRATDCLYGCINNGGNNMFTNCDFSSNKHGLLMDNSNNQSPNNSHGSMIGCVFNHTDSNTGIGIEILNCKPGYIFQGCQIFFSQIKLEDANGIVFEGCNFGDTNCDITITGGNTTLFANNIHKAAPPITITGNTKVHFVNCYVRDTGAPVTA